MINDAVVICAKNAWRSRKARRISSGPSLASPDRVRQHFSHPQPCSVVSCSAEKINFYKIFYGQNERKTFLWLQELFLLAMPFAERRKIFSLLSEREKANQNPPKWTHKKLVQVALQSVTSVMPAINFNSACLIYISLSPEERTRNNWKRVKA